MGLWVQCLSEANQNYPGSPPIPIIQQVEASSGSGYTEITNLLSSSKSSCRFLLSTKPRTCNYCQLISISEKGQPLPPQKNAGAPPNSTCGTHYFWLLMDISELTSSYLCRKEGSILSLTP